MPAYLINDTNQSALSQLANSLIICVRSAGLLDEPVSNDETERGVSGRSDIAASGGSGLICCSNSVESGLIESNMLSKISGDENASFKACSN